VFYLSGAYISYSSHDKTLASTVVDALEEKGISCWIAPRNIPAGSNYGAAIIKAIRDCDVLILLLSENSNASTAVFREVQKAFEENKIIIPLRVEDIQVSDDLGFYLSGLHWINANPDQNDFSGLVLDVNIAIEKAHQVNDKSNGNEVSMHKVVSNSNGTTVHKTEPDSNSATAKRFGSDNTTAQKAKPQQKKVTSTKKILLLCILLCIALVISAFVFINRTDDTNRSGVTHRLTYCEALQIALDFADVQSDQISGFTAEIDTRDSRIVWDIDFEVEKYGDDDDWAFYIDAYTGEILFWERN
jgi:uncharacterized membrane protein YkoI